MDELNENECLELENVDTPKKPKNIKFIAGVLSGIVGIGIVILVILNLTSAKFKYFSLIGNTFNSMIEYVEKGRDSVFGRILDVDLESKLSIDTEVNAQVETEDKEILAWLNGFKSIKLSAHEKSDMSNSYFNSDINISLNGEDFIVADLVRKNNIFSANVDGITDGYISVDNNRLPELWEKLGFTGPDKFNSQVEMISNFGLSEDEINDFKKSMINVGKAFSKAFGDEDFSKGKESINYNGKTIETNYIDLKMNSYEMNNGIIFALEQLIAEDRAIDILLKLSNAYDNLYAQLGYEIKPFSRDEFLEALNYVLAEVRNLEFSEDDGMVIRFYYEGKDIVKIEIFNLNYTSSVLKLVAIDDGIEKYYEYTNEVQSLVDNVYVTEKGVYTHTIDINYINYETGEFLDEYKQTIVLTVDNSDKDNCKIIATTNDDVMTYTLNGSISGDNKIIDFGMIGKDETSSNNVNIKIGITENVEFDEKVAEETFNMSDAGVEELNAKKDSIVKNWNEFSSKNENKFIQAYTALSIYIGTMNQGNSYTDLVVNE